MSVNSRCFLIKFHNPKLVCKRITDYPAQHHNKILIFEGGNLVAECPTLEVATRLMGISRKYTMLTFMFCTWF